tara:strand:+ start:31149 stop:32624 length:1476 start_codon:yes stop_codon:yes gene_type:complete
MSIETDSTIAVIGAGAMGSGIAQVAAQAGHPVILVDTTHDALKRSRAGIADSFAKLVSRGKMTVDESETALSRVHWTTDMAEVAPARLAIEAIIENMEIKTSLFGQLEELIAPDAFLASNTSSLSINALANTIKRPQRFTGLHFFNPVPVMKLVEVIPGERTDEAVIASLLGLMQQWRKIAVRVRDVPGFIVNRVARPYYAEGFAALGEGIDPAIIDHALTSAGGFRMGPLALADMIGHDVNYVVARFVYDAYDGKTRFRPQPSQQALYDGGRLGRKCERGVYDYSADLPNPEYVEPATAPRAIEVAVKHGGIREIIDMTRDAGIAVSISDALPADSLRVDGCVMALGDGRSLATRGDADVLVDQARDFARASIWLVTAKSAIAAQTAASLTQLLGKQLLQIPDRPGQIVLRTLAQLANAAADAVTDAVASPADIDAAMRFGANHPEGPLEWAARFGYGRLSDTLENIARASGDDMYLPSPLFDEPAAATR